AVPFNSYPSHNKTAYILFTSGTTGIPKGVPITFGNIQTFLNGFIDAGYQIEAKDRFLQMFELTFDLSVMCFLVPLTHSASFFPLPGGMIRTLGLYHILESCSVTVSLMVPSAINMLLPYLGDIHLPDLKYSLFCGEALKTNLVDQWKQCVPNARIDNVYGPTEATIFCTIQQINREHPEADSMNGVCNIGLPMSGVDAVIFSEGKEVHENMVSGELCLCGNQVTPGYLKNDLQNQQRFFKYNGVDFYKTGDLVSRNEKGTLVYLGRLDDQVKIQGFRVELAELEVAATHILPEHMSVAVGFTDATGNTRLALFVKELKSEPEWVRDQMSGMIPDYMVPHLVLEIDDFPLNNNGKTDKNKLKQLALGYM
ncbi:MAG: AMP-binding protein, partial [Bacteroidia bacterium]|nr:AMP-binding protein [Bacteroidia bacterium]